jgi:SAM-dependent methyltransferase
MRLIDIIRRIPAPFPWSEGDNIPWNEPEFSQRMLKEHLSQEHDAASRRSELIDRHVGWIHEALLQGKPARILDLGCGPGLYASRLAGLGHTCTGIDYSPASIHYARQQAEQAGLPCSYIEADIRSVSYGSGYDLAMLIYGEFNVFRPTDAEKILLNIHQALKPGGWLLLEPHTEAAVSQMGSSHSIWYSAASGLFGDQPYLCLKESHWDEDSRAATIRYYIIDAGTSQVTRYAQSLQAYTNEQYQKVITDCGFASIQFFPSLAGEPVQSQEAFIAITARRQGAA